MVATSNEIITLREDVFKFTGFVANLESIGSSMHTYVHGFIDYLSIFAEAREAFSYISMYVIDIRACALACATVLCRLTRLPTVPGPRKRAVLKHRSERSGQSNNPDFVCQLGFGMNRIT